MASFLRLLENSGIGSFRLLLEGMSRSQAISLFKFHGVPGAETLSPDDLRKEWHGLVKKHHPDVSGDADVMKEINAAYDVLKGGGSPSGAASRETDSGDEWVMAGYSGGMRPMSSIYRQNYSDINFIKKRMWELSGKSRQEWSVSAWDGRYFRGSFTVYGSSAIFKDMAEAMVTWNSGPPLHHKTQAVLAHKRNSKVLHVLYYDGDFLDGSATLEHDSFNLNPGNDQSFCNRLNDELERIAKTQLELPLSEGTLLEYRSERKLTMILYRQTPDIGWDPVGIINSIHDVLALVGANLTSDEMERLADGEVVSLNRSVSPVSIAIRSFEAILPVEAA